MNNYAWAGQGTAILAIVAGILTCFWGYRIVKVSLAIFGFVVGAYAGYEAGISLLHASNELALGCALVGGLVGMGLCLWLYFLGVFLVGATAGTIVAAAVFSGVGQQLQPILYLVFPIVFGIIALIAQKFMIVLCTAFSGAYLVVAGIWPFVAPGQDFSRIWLHPSQSGSAGTLGYAALAVWLVVGIAGVRVQFRSHRTKVEVEKQSS